MDAATQFSALFVVLFIIVLNAIVNTILKTRSFQLRRMPALEVLPEITGESIEASRPVHISFGGAAPGTDTTLLALAGAEFAYYTAQQLTISDKSPLFTVTEGAALPLAVDVLRQAYQSRGLLAERFKAVNARWYPASARALAFAGGVTAMQSEENIAANFLVGSFGVELALILDASYRKQRPSVAVSNRLEGQAVAYAMADFPLIGEEIFAAGGYLAGDSSRRRRNGTLDVMRWLLVAVIVIMIILNFTRPF